MATNKGKAKGKGKGKGSKGSGAVPQGDRKGLLKAAQQSRTLPGGR